MIQAAIFVLSVLSIWLVSCTPPNRWAYVFGLAAQPFWLYASATAEQWGQVALAFIYTALWLRGFLLHWINPRKGIT